MVSLPSLPLPVRIYNGLRRLASRVGVPDGRLDANFTKFGRRPAEAKEHEEHYDAGKKREEHPATRNAGVAAEGRVTALKPLRQESQPCADGRQKHGAQDPRKPRYG